MHRVVLFSAPVVSNGETFYGRLYGGTTEEKIRTAARADYRTLLVREQWEGDRGDTFRTQEGWTLTHITDGSTAWWSFDEDKYSYCLGFSPIPDQFVESCPLTTKSVVLLNGWVPLRFADTNNDDYIINGAFYYSTMDANPNDLYWSFLDEQEEDDLPF